MNLAANEKLPSFSKHSKISDVFKWLKNSSNLKVTLQPMEIKTFIFKTDKNNKGGYYNGIIDTDDSSSAQTFHLFSCLFVMTHIIYILFY